MAFTAADVKKLREMTNVGMMDCKKALTETDGDMDKAIDYLREKGLIDGELFEVESLSKLRELRDVLYGDAAFNDQNAIGNNMYSVGLNHFVDFLGLEVGGDAAAVPKVLTNDDLVKLDAPIDKPARAPKVVYGWNRDRVIVEQVLGRRLRLARGASDQPRVGRQKPRRLVDHDQFVILVDDFERQELGLHLRYSVRRESA